VKRPGLLLALGVGSALILAACGDSGGSRSDAVAAITTTAVPDRFASFADAASSLTGSVEGWCADADGGGLAEQVNVTRIAWVSVLPFWFGPVMERRSRFIIDPTVTTSDVLDILDAGDPVDAAALRELYGADQRGLAVIEELIGLAGGAVPERQLCEYATASAGLVAEEAAALAATWRDVGPDLAVDDEAANATIEGAVNEVLFGLVGLANDPAVHVAEAKLAGMRWTILGDPTASTGNTVGMSGLLDDEVVEQLTAELDAAAGLDAEAIMDLERTITTNVVSSLGLSVQFSDADGDG
jgi:predicted lipoprotein